MSDQSKVYLASTARDTERRPAATANLRRILRALEPARGREVVTVADPSQADCLLFVSPQRDSGMDVAMSSLYRRHWRRSVVVDFSDSPLAALPGVYVGLPLSRHRPEWHRGGHYLRVGDAGVGDEFPLTTASPRWLFSFVGDVATCEPVRRRCLALQHPRALLRDVPSRHRWEVDGDYQSVLTDSIFVLAPRGRAPSSWRLFEAMRMGRVPVIISDEWLAPSGVEWEACAIRVPEQRIEDIPAILEAAEPRAAAMGAKAREIWLREFQGIGGALRIVRDAMGIVSALESAPMPSLLGTAAAQRRLLPLAKDFVRELIER